VVDAARDNFSALREASDRLLGSIDREVARALDKALQGEDISVDEATTLFEARIGLEAAQAGLASLTLRYPQQPLNSELGVVSGFLQQSAEAFEALARKLVDVLPLRGFQA